MTDVTFIKTIYFRYDSLFIKDQGLISHLKLSPGIQ